MFTTVGLASCVFQLTDFGIKLVVGIIELNAEISNLELKTSHVRKLANKIIALEHEDADRLPFGSKDQLNRLAESCDMIAKDLLSVLDDLKVKK